MTPTTVRQVGAALVANGYLPIPIRRGEKRPAIDAWERARLDASALTAFPEHGAGVLCGQGDLPIIAVDVDISHSVIGRRIVEWCRAYLGHGGERIGAAPRVLLVYRAAESGWGKCTSAAFVDPAQPVKANGERNIQRVEVLGDGQQFVAYHTHPDTHRPYEWTDLYGGIEHFPAAGLPVVARSKVDELMTFVEKCIAETDGLERVASGGAGVRQQDPDGLMGLSPRVGLSVPQIVDALVRVPNDDSIDYDTCVLTVGGAVHHETHGSDAGFRAWHDWCRTSSKYTHEGFYRQRWESFGRYQGSPATMASVLKMARDRNEVEGESSDVRLGRRMAEMLHRDGFLYEHNGDGWLMYRNGTYVRCSKGEEQEAAKKLGPMLLRELARETTDADGTARVMKLVSRAQSAAGISAALTQAQSDPRIAVSPEEFDRDPELLNVANGLVHLPTGELRPHNRAERLRRQSPIRFEPGAAAPTFQRFLHEVSKGDAEWVDFLQRACGYTLSGFVAEEVLFFLLGAGANGKSVFGNVQRRIFGNYAATMPASLLSLSSRDSEAATPTLAQLPGVRLALANEVEAGSRLSAQTVKVLCSTESISARHLYGKTFFFTPTHATWVRANHRPIVTDTDEGIWRRIVLIPFDRNLAPHERDTNLEERLMTEAPGILAWMVRGFAEYRRRGLRPTGRIAAASAAYRKESDLLGQWLEESTVPGVAFEAMQPQAYSDYVGWCNQQGVRPMAKKSFTRGLEERGITSGQRGSGGRERIYVGFKLHYGLALDAQDAA